MHVTSRRDVDRHAAMTVLDESYSKHAADVTTNATTQMSAEHRPVNGI
jgi:hypothetical protein